MNKVSDQEKESYSFLHEETEASALRAAFSAMEEKEIEDSQKAQKDNACKYSIEAQRKTVQAIQKKLATMRKSQKKNTVFIQIGKSVAIAIMTVFLGIAVAMAAFESVRIAVFQFFANEKPQYTELMLKKSVVDVPKDWKGTYFPTWLPEGYVLEEINADWYEVAFKNTRGDHLIFGEYTEDVEMSIDTENANNYKTTIGNQEVFVSEKNGNCLVYWFVNDRYFTVRYKGTCDVALEVVDNVQKIK